MFYSTQILSKKGALGTIWIASHLEKRLKRSQIFETSIPASVDSIINPEAPLALRLSGQLLLGIVRVYLRKLEYLSKDAQSAVENLNKSSTQGANVDLEDEGRAAYGTITLEDGEPGVALADDAFMFQGTASDAFNSRGAGGLGGGGGFAPAYSPGDSLTPVEDVSDVFGSHWAIEDEKFEASGEELNRRFSIELERLRAEAAAPPLGPGDMFFQAPQDEDLAPVPGELMEVPPLDDELFAVAAGQRGGATPAKTPASELRSGGAPLPGTSDIRITPQSLGLELLPEVEGGPAASGGTFGTFGDTFHDDAITTQQTPPSGAKQATQQQQEAAAAAGELGATPAQQRRRQQQPRRKKKGAQLDVDGQGQPATSLSVKDIRTLLNDRSSLQIPRGMGQGKQAATVHPDRFDVVAQSEEARQSVLFRPAAFSVLAPELMELYSRAFGTSGRGAGTRAGLASPRQPPAAPAAAEEEAGAGAATPRRGLEEEEGGAAAAVLSGNATSAGGFSAGEFDFGGPSELTFGQDGVMPPLYGGEDLVEPPGTQRGSEPPAGPEQGPAAGRRSSLAAVELGPLGGGEGEEERRWMEEGGEDSEARATGEQLPQSSFTQRSRQVLAEYRCRLLPGAGSKRRHPSQGGLAAAPLSLDAVVAGKSRAEACRWFYETLVLRNNDFVELEQREPYGDISILAKPKMAAGDSA